MSPSLPAARPVYLWSLPAFAILLSFLWYRKKRGSLKTGIRSVVKETKDDQISVDCEDESEDACDNNIVLPNCEIKVIVESDQEVVDIVDQVASRSTSRSCADIPEPELEATCPEESELITLESDKKLEIVEVVQKEEIKKLEESQCGEKITCKNMAKKKSKKSNDLSIDQREKEENTANILEKKLVELDLSATKCNGNTVEEKQLNEDVAERDSANNSPSEVMLACPSVSGYSDTHSEGSNDSGKGCSEMLTPSRTPASGNSVSGDLPATTVYEFEIPQPLVGRLIGRHGNNVHEIKKATNASIYIKKHPVAKDLKICAIEGTQMDIDSALDMIRRQFSEKRFPDLTLEQIVIELKPLMVPISTENYQVYLIEGINNDVILSSLVTAGHFFLQQPTHPTFPALSRLAACMAHCYSQPNAPNIPEGVGAGVLCAAPVHDGWYRAQITEMEAGSDMCCVKFVDYGGYMNLPVSSLRQIRADFINLPFQAAECYLADVAPANEKNIWSEEAKECVEKLTFGNILLAQVRDYAYPGVPLIYLYTVVNNQFILINEELVNRGYAEWLYCEPMTEDVQGEENGAVSCSEIHEAQ